MFQGLYTSMNYEPIADYGAHSILNIGGSLTSYIQTGNPYDKHYYHVPYANNLQNDVFHKSDNNRTKTIKVLGVIGLTLAAGIALFLGIKKADIPHRVTSLFDKVKTKAKPISGFFDKAQETLTKSFNKLKSKIKH